jgi:hypothetical protein
VVKFIEHDLKREIRLLAFISLRGFFMNRAKIKSELKSSIVIPMVPGVRNWRKNSILLQTIVRLKKPRMIIGRSVLATKLALMQKSAGWNGKVIYDGRGAIAAEWKEYGVISDQQMLSEIESLEKECILISDYRIAVSSALVDFWQKEYKYNSSKHVIIPCTINSAFSQNKNLAEVLKKKAELGFLESDIVYAYSGSIAGWQSLDLLKSVITPVLASSSKMKLLILAVSNEFVLNLQNEFPDQVRCMKVPSFEIPIFLSTADYGLLIREISVTNRVASPVKFAEYLFCGLPVIISQSLGDYSEFVLRHECGFLSNNIPFEKPNPGVKTRLKELAVKQFTKQSHSAKYSKLLEIGLK